MHAPSTNKNTNMQHMQHMHRDEDHFKPESQYEEEMWGMKAVEVGLTKIADTVMPNENGNATSQSWPGIRIHPLFFSVLVY
jgi:hypothetical protein